MTEILETLCFIILPVVGLHDLYRLCLSENTNVVKYKLVLPCISCVAGIIRTQWVLWSSKPCTSRFDFAIVVAIFMVNSCALYDLLANFPYAWVSLTISVYFNFVMCTNIIKRCYRVQCLEEILMDFLTRRNQPVNHAMVLGTWVVPHRAHPKVNDDCLICLEPLSSSEYVHVCLQTIDDTVNVMLHVTDTLMQCETCKCTLHLQCQMSCKSRCPICSISRHSS